MNRAIYFGIGLLLWVAGCSDAGDYLGRVHLHIENDAAKQTLNNRFKRLAAGTPAPSGPADVYILGIDAAKGPLTLTGKKKTADENGDLAFESAGPLIAAVDVNQDQVPDGIFFNAKPGAKRSMSVPSAVTDSSGAWISAQADKVNYAPGDVMTVTVVGYLEEPAPVSLEVWNKWRGGFHYFTSEAQEAPAGPLVMTFTIFIGEEWPATNSKSGADYAVIPVLGEQPFGGDNFNILDKGQGEPKAPKNPSVVINGGADATTEAGVTLTLSAAGAAHVQLAADKATLEDSEWVPYAASLPWTLGSALGMHTVYVRYANRLGALTDVVSDSIRLVAPGGGGQGGEPAGYGPSISQPTQISGDQVSWWTDADATCRWDVAAIDFASMTGPCTDGPRPVCTLDTFTAGPAWIWVSCADGDGASTPVSVQINVDRTPPAILSTSPASGYRTAATAAAVSVSLDEPGTCRVAKTDVAWSAMTQACNVDGPATVTCLVNDLGEGSQSGWLACADAWGNAYGAGEAAAWVVERDTAPPALVEIAPASGAMLAQSSVTLQLSLNKPANCRWGYSEAPVASLGGICESGFNTVSRCPVTGLSEGPGRIHISCTDELENEAVGLTAWDFIVDQTGPRILSHSPWGGVWPLEGASVELALDEESSCRVASTIGEWGQMPVICDAPGTTALCSLSGLDAGEHRLYARCVDSMGNLGDPYDLDVWNLAPPPEAPLTLTGAVLATLDVALDWEPVGTAETWRIERSLEGGAWGTLGEVPFSVTSWTDPVRIANVAVAYRLRGVSAGGVSDPGNIVSLNMPVVDTPPAAPTGLKAVPGYGRISMTWTPVEGAVSYRVWYATISGAPYGGTGAIEGVAPITVSEPAAVLSELSPETPYYVAVSAVGPTGLESDYSEERRVYPAPLVTPNMLQGEPARRSLVRDSLGNLYAAAVEGDYSSTRVYVYRSQDDGRTWSPLGGGPVGSPSADYTKVALAIDGNDRLHLGWMWRETADFDDYAQIVYAQWDGQQWTTPAFVGQIAGAGQYIASIVVDRRDRVHLFSVGSDSETYQTLIRYSRCDVNCHIGGAWLAPVPIQNAPPSGVASVALDSQDRLHLAFSALDPANPPGVFNFVVYYTYCAGDCRDSADWVTPYVPAPLPGYSQSGPDILVDGAERVHLAWQGQDSDHPNQRQIRQASCQWPCNGAADWSTPVRMTDRFGHAQGQIHLTLGFDDRLYFLWRGGTDELPQNNIWSASCELPCTPSDNWSVPLRHTHVAESGDDSSAMSVAARFARHGGRDGMLDFLWSSQRTVGTNLLHYGRLSGVAPPNNTWSRIEQAPGTNAHLTTRRRLVQRASGEIWYAYVGGVSRSVDRGTTWEGIDVPHANMRYPSLAVGVADSLHMTWYDPGTNALYYSRRTESSWSAPLALEAAIGSGHHALQIDSGGGVHILSFGSGITYRVCTSDCQLAGSWSTSVVGSGAGPQHPDLLIDDAGVLHATWIESGVLRYGTCSNACSNAANWSTPITPRSRTETLSEPALGLDAGGGLWLAFRVADLSSTANGLYVTRCAGSCTAGGNWQQEFPVSGLSAGYDVTGAHFGRGRDGATYLVFVEKYRTRLLMCHDACGPGDWGEASSVSRHSYSQAPTLFWASNHQEVGPLLLAFSANFPGIVRPIVHRDPFVRVGSAVAVSGTIPLPVEDLNATPGAGAIHLTWSDAANNESYQRIERTVDGGAWASLVVLGANVNAYSDTGLAEGVTYGYRVIAGNGAGDAAPSNTVTASPLATAPTAPANLQAATLSASSIRLTWTDQSANETGFRVELWTGSSWTLSASVGAGVTVYDATGLLANTFYLYRVRAHNLAGQSSPSNEAGATTQAGAPGAPSSLAATAENPFRIRLNWSDNSGNETGFRIQRWSGSSWVQIAAVGANVTQYKNTGLQSGTLYQYRVYAYNGSGSSAYSNQAQATTPTPMLMYFQDFEYSGLFNETTIGNQQWNDGTDFWASGSAGRIRFATTSPYVWAGARALWFSALQECGTADCNQIIVYRSAAANETVRVRFYAYNPNASNVTVSMQRAGGTAVQRTVTPGSYQLITADLDSTLSTGAVMVHLGLIPRDWHLDMDDLHMERFMK